jgi:Immunity protein Imm5
VENNMKINAEIISKFNPCAERFNNFKAQYPEFNSTLEDFILLENITYSDKVWVFTRLATPMQNVKWSFLCASKVLSIFEQKYRRDKRPRLVLESVERFINNPTDKNKNATYASYASYATYIATYTTYTAYSATHAAFAADAAIHTACAACAATNITIAAHVADCAAYATQETDLEKEVNLLMMIEAIEE